MWNRLDLREIFFAQIKNFQHLPFPSHHPCQTIMGSDPAVKQPVFKKRSRQNRTKARKRVDSHSLEPSHPDHSADQRVLPSIKQASVLAKNVKAWQREDYSAPLKNINDEQTQVADMSADATAERVKSKDRTAFAPDRAPTNIRTTLKIDYQPDVCKDYKETGYCGFGYACKFLHDRSDYKAGWQLDRDWAAKEKERRQRILRGEDPDAGSEEENAEKDDDGLPFACHICRSQFKRPVVTLCEHYFCEDCVVTRMQKDPTCAVCKKQLRGTLNPAVKLAAKIKSKS